MKTAVIRMFGVILGILACSHTTQGLTARVTCDNRMKFFADGELKASNNAWTTTTSVSFPSDTDVIAIECQDLHSVGGIIASLSNGVVTDDQWKCSHVHHSGWEYPYFDDSDWQNAYEIGPNGMSPWNTRPGISSSARWIWTGATTWHGRHRQVYCRLDLCPKPAVTVNATCDNNMKLYADGHLVKSNNFWTQTSTVTVSGHTEVISIECDDLHVVGGILASTSTGLMTDSSWKCSPKEQLEWTKPDFDDSLWNNAYEIGNNGMSPWYTRPNISPSAKWIWTEKGQWKGGHKHAYCRKQLVAPIKVAATCDNRMRLYVDGQLVASNNYWWQTSMSIVSGHSKVIAIECLDMGVVGGILASVSTDPSLDTSSRWKCSSRPRRGWNNAGFDDSSWTNGYEIGNNGMSPWGSRYGIRSSAKWIWTSASTWHGGHKRVFCRLDLCDEKQIPTTTARTTTQTTEKTTPHQTKTWPTLGTKPTKHTFGTRPTLATKTWPTLGTKPTKHTIGTRPTKPTLGTKPTKYTLGTRPTKETTTQHHETRTRPTKPTVGTKPTRHTLGTRPTLKTLPTIKPTFNSKFARKSIE